MPSRGSAVPLEARLPGETAPTIATTKVVVAVAEEDPALLDPPVVLPPGLVIATAGTMITKEVTATTAARVVRVRTAPLLLLAWQRHHPLGNKLRALRLLLMAAFLAREVILVMLAWEHLPGSEHHLRLLDSALLLRPRLTTSRL